jgi:hypothetical protein
MKIMSKIFLGFALLMILNSVSYAQGVPGQVVAVPAPVPVPVPAPVPGPQKPTDPPCDVVEIQLPICEID